MQGSAVLQPLRRFAAPQARREPLQRRNRNATVGVRCFNSGSQKGQASKLRLSFKVPYRVNFGQNVCLVGEGELLGNWDVKRAKRMEWSSGDVWHVQMELSINTPAKLVYKYVVVNQDGNPSVWKPGDNYAVTLPPATHVSKPPEVAIMDAWDGSIKDVKIVGLDDDGFEVELTPEQEIAAVKSLTSKAMAEVLSSMGESCELQAQLGDPAAPEILRLDRQVAASFTKMRDLTRVLHAVAPAGRIAERSEAGA